MVTMLSCGISSITAYPPETSFHDVMAGFPFSSFASHWPARFLSEAKPELASVAADPGSENSSDATTIAMRYFMSSSLSFLIGLRSRAALPSAKLLCQIKGSGLSSHFLFRKALQPAQYAWPAIAVHLHHLRILAETAVCDAHASSTLRGIQFPTNQTGWYSRGPTGFPCVREQPRRLHRHVFAGNLKRIAGMAG